MESQPIWINALVFVAAAGLIWWAGTRLERYADAISDRTGLGQAFTGVLLLATATSLPEVATTVTAIVVLNDATLAVYNLLGGVAFQTAILAVADRAKRRRGALTFFSPTFVLLIQGVGLVMLLQLAIAGLTARGVPAVFSVSLWPVAIAATFVGVLYLTHRYRGLPRWTATKADDVAPANLKPASRAPDGGGDEGPRHSTRTLSFLFAGMSVLVLVGGWFATRAADVLADQTGLGPALLGATLLAVATSLPELSTTISATRHDRYPLAISNVFGSNSVDVALLLVADVLYRDGTIMEHVEGPAVFVAAIGAAMTCIYLWGLMERQNRTILGVGWDSAAVVSLYAAGMTVLYLRQ